MTSLLAEAKQGKVSHLSSRLEKLTNTAVTPYDDEAKYFVKDVREAKRADLKARIVKTLGEVTALHLDHVRGEIVHIHLEL